MREEQKHILSELPLKSLQWLIKDNVSCSVRTEVSMRQKGLAFNREALWRRRKQEQQEPVA